jgi:hypothetical protein
MKQILVCYEAKGIDTSTFSEEGVYVKFKMTGTAYYSPENPNCFSSYIDRFTMKGVDQSFLHYTRIESVEVKNDKYSSKNFYPVFFKGKAVPATSQRLVFNAMKDLRLIISQSDIVRDSKLLQLEMDTQNPKHNVKYVEAAKAVNQEPLDENDIAAAFEGTIVE